MTRFSWKDFALGNQSAYAYWEKLCFNSKKYKRILFIIYSMCMDASTRTTMTTTTTESEQWYTLP